jgi:hypothetical protein
MSRSEYNRAYYEKNKERLREYNKEKQRMLYTDEEKRQIKLEKNRKRYQAYVGAYMSLFIKTTSDDSSLSSPDMDSETQSLD